MLELGQFSAAAHHEAGLQVAASADVLVTIGVRARGIAEGALDAGMLEDVIFQCDDAYLAGTELEMMLREGDLVLVKGSQGMRLERIVEEIMFEPEKAETLLVRQGEEWKGR